jgi:hypothetical protein
MEPRFGHDFSNVRVHVDARAAESAKAVDAAAYTVGKDVVFGAGQYAPSTSEGQRLLAHELTHVLQQIERPSQLPLRVGSSGDVLEREADRASEDIQRMPNSSSRHRQDAAPTIQRMVNAVPEEEVVRAQDDVQDGDSPAGALGGVDGLSDTEDQDVDETGVTLTPLQFKKRKGAAKKGGHAEKAERTITAIGVDLSSQTLTLTWSDGDTSTPVTISSGKGLPDTAGDPCKTPNVSGSNCTPVGEFAVGKKGGADYRNQKGDKMSWYVEFESSRAIGIHDSQPVTGAPASHGCVRVDETTARRINRNVTSRTRVSVSGKAPTAPWTSTKPKKRTLQRKVPSLDSQCVGATPGELLQRRTPVASGLETWQTREDPDVEAQRLEAFNIVTEHRSYLRSEALKYSIPAEAIAGAILWEALENPYRLVLRPRTSRLGPGKVHPFAGEEAEKVEQEGRIKLRPAGGPLDRLPASGAERGEVLKDSKVAITYIAAIMRRHADNYLRIAGVDVSTNVGVLCTLYQGGHSEERAQRLKERRSVDASAQPQMGDEMGPWVVKNIETVRGWVNPPPRPR